MKASTIKCLLVALVAIVSASCEKYSEDLNVRNMTFQNKDVEMIVNPYSLNQHIQSSGLQEEISFNLKIKQIAELIKPYFKSKELNKYIFFEAEKNINHCVDLRNIANWPCFDGLRFSKEQGNTLADAVASVDLTHMVLNGNGNVEQEHYIPALYFCNIENADLNKMPILGTGIDVNEELPGMSKYEDCIIVWYYDTLTDEYVEGIMSEEMAIQSTNPVFIVDNAVEELTKIGILPNDDLPQTKSNGVTINQFHLSSYEYKVNNRNEGTGKSEFCVSGVIIDENNHSSSISFWSNNGKDYHQIAKIDQSEVGLQLYKWVPFVHPQDVMISDLIPLGNNYIFWNTFERDWARSRKTLGTPTVNGTTYYLTGNMRYSSDWYAFNPTDIQSNCLNLTYIYNNGMQLFANSKGNIGIWKINN